MCPLECAINLDDKRVIKMVLETSQMLCTALSEHQLLESYPYSAYPSKKLKKAYYFKNTTIRAYAPTHKNHPSNVWVRHAKCTYNWTLDHLVALSSEYTHRMGKIHKSSYLIPYFKKMKQYIPEVNGSMPMPPNCAANKSKGIDYKHIPCTNQAYILYLKDRWKTDTLIPKWTNRTPPEWY